MMHKEGDDLTGMMDKLSKTYGNDFLRVNTFSEICSKMSEENQTWYSKLWSSICSNKYKILGAVAAVIGLVIASFVLYKTFDEDVKMTDE
nr:putative 3A; membrane-associated protein [tremovirus B1]